MKARSICFSSFVLCQLLGATVLAQVSEDCNAPSRWQFKPVSNVYYGSGAEYAYGSDCGCQKAEPCQKPYQKPCQKSYQKPYQKSSLTCRATWSPCIEKLAEKIREKKAELKAMFAMHGKSGHLQKNKCAPVQKDKCAPVQKDCAPIQKGCDCAVQKHSTQKHTTQKHSTQKHGKSDKCSQQQNCCLKSAFYWLFAPEVYYAQKGKKGAPGVPVYDTDHSDPTVPDPARDPFSDDPVPPLPIEPTSSRRPAEARDRTTNANRASRINPASYSESGAEEQSHSILRRKENQNTDALHGCTQPTLKEPKLMVDLASHLDATPISAAGKTERASGNDTEPPAAPTPKPIAEKPADEVNRAEPVAEHGTGGTGQDSHDVSESLSGLLEHGSATAGNRSTLTIAAPVPHNPLRN